MGTSETFKSVQKCKQPLVWMILIGAAIFSWYSVYQQILFRIPFGSDPAPDALLIVIWIVFGVGFPIGLFATRLSIQIDEDEFTYRLFPLHLQTHSFRLADIKKMEAVSIRPILDFGGWGIRFSHKGKGYIIGGNKAVKVIFKTGRPVYFSTDEPQRIAEAYREFTTD